MTKSGYKRTHIAVKTEISVQKAYVQSTLCPLYIFITWLITATTLFAWDLAGFSTLFPSIATSKKMKRLPERRKDSVGGGGGIVTGG